MRRANPEVLGSWSTAQQATDALADWAERYGDGLCALYEAVCQVDERTARSFGLTATLDALEPRMTDE